MVAPKRVVFSDLKTSSDESRARWLLKEPFFTCTARCSISFTKEVCVPSSEYVFEGSFKSFIYSIVIVFCIETSNVSLYRIDFIGVTNRL